MTKYCNEKRNGERKMVSYVNLDSLSVITDVRDTGESHVDGC